jgi:hypothetical protein
VSYLVRSFTEVVVIGGIIESSLNMPIDELSPMHVDFITRVLGVVPKSKRDQGAK